VHRICIFSVPFPLFLNSGRLSTRPCPPARSHWFVEDATVLRATPPRSNGSTLSPSFPFPVYNQAGSNTHQSPLFLVCSFFTSLLDAVDSDLSSFLFPYIAVITPIFIAPVSFSWNTSPPTTNDSDDLSFSSLALSRSALFILEPSLAPSAMRGFLPITLIGAGLPVPNCDLLPNARSQASRRSSHRFFFFFFFFFPSVQCIDEDAVLLLLCGSFSFIERLFHGPLSPSFHLSSFSRSFPGERNNSCHCPTLASRSCSSPSFSLSAMRPLRELLTLSSRSKKSSR